MFNKKSSNCPNCKRDLNRASFRDERMLTRGGLSMTRNSLPVNDRSYQRQLGEFPEYAHGSSQNHNNNIIAQLINPYEKSQPNKIWSIYLRLKVKSLGRFYLLPAKNINSQFIQRFFFWWQQQLLKINQVRFLPRAFAFKELTLERLIAKYPNQEVNTKVSARQQPDNQNRSNVCIKRKLTRCPTRFLLDLWKIGSKRH